MNNVINPNDPVSPIFDWNQLETGEIVHKTVNEGMSIRAEFAKCALAALLSNPVHSQKWTFTFWQKIRKYLDLKTHIISSYGNKLPEVAVTLADELIAELNKSTK